MQDVVSRTGVYLDSGTCLFHFSQLTHPYRFTEENYFQSNIDSFKQSEHKIKIASFHVQFPGKREWLDRFYQTYNIAVHTFVFCSELHLDTVGQLIEIDLPNVTIFACGFLTHQFQHAHFFNWMDWFVTSAYFYQTHPDLLEEKLLPHKNKSKLFDALLGNGREHRTVAYDYIQKNLADVTLMTYHKNSSLYLMDPNKFIMETEGLEFLSHIDYTCTICPVKYYGHEMTLSQIIPLSIYNQTYYTIVTETNAFDHFNFYTEKIVKPLIAGRLFIAVSSKHYLKNLRALGFRTFDSL